MNDSIQGAVTETVMTALAILRQPTTEFKVNGQSVAQYGQAIANLEQLARSLQGNELIVSSVEQEEQLLLEQAEEAEADPI